MDKPFPFARHATARLERSHVLKDLSVNRCGDCLPVSPALPATKSALADASKNGPETGAPQ
jgi:hypothetical protein